MTSSVQTKRDFKGIWIPKEVWLDTSLSYFEKFLLSEIDSLDNEDGCFASNDYFCKFFNEKERKIQDALANLKAKGYIYIEKFDGRKRTMRSNLKRDKSLFSTSEVQKPNDNTLFSTPGVSDSAPLPLYIDNKEIEKRNSAAPLLDNFFLNLKKEVPEFNLSKLKHTKAQLMAMERLLKAQGEDKIKEVYLYAHKDTFWRAIVHSAVSLEKKFLTIYLQMKDKKSPKKNPGDQMKQIAIEAVRDYQSTQCELRVTDTEIWFCPTVGQQLPYPLKFTENGFKDQLDNQLRKKQFTKVKKNP